MGVNQQPSILPIAAGGDLSLDDLRMIVSNRVFWH